LPREIKDEQHETLHYIKEWLKEKVSIPENFIEHNIKNTQSQKIKREYEDE